MVKCLFLEDSKNLVKLVKSVVVDLVGYQHFLLILMELVKPESEIKYCYASRNMKSKHVTREFLKTLTLNTAAAQEILQFAL